MSYFADVQRAVLLIPRGKVAAYGDVAKAAGHPGTARQVALALRDAGVRGIPWQRVLGQGGKILLPGEAGLQQRTLLELEGVRFRGPRVDMQQCGYIFPARRRKTQSMSGKSWPTSPPPAAPTRRFPSVYFENGTHTKEARGRGRNRNRYRNRSRRSQGSPSDAACP